MNAVTNLNATRQEWLRLEAIEALKSGRWKDLDKLVKRIRKRWDWATDHEIMSALDQLHEAGRLDSRSVDLPAGLGSIYETHPVTQWKLIPASEPRH